VPFITASPDGQLHVHTGSAGSITANSDLDDLVVEINADGGITILTPAANQGFVGFGDPDDDYIAGIDYDHNGNTFRIFANNSARIIIDSNGDVGIGTELLTPDHLLHLSSTTASQLGITHTIGADSVVMGVDGNGLFTITTVDGGGVAGHIVLAPDGNVGIGTTTPDSTLEVNGSVVINGTLNWTLDAQGDDNYEITIPGITAIWPGLMVTWQANTINTGAATLEISSEGLLYTIKKLHDQDLASGDIEAGQIVVTVFDGTNWQMISQLAQ